MRNAVKQALLVAIVLTLAATTPVLPQEQKIDGTVDSLYGRTKINLPESTTAGDWNGTWVYMSRDYRVALWMKRGEKLPEYRLQLVRSAPLEQIVTDWQGQGVYDLDGAPGSFSMTLTEGDANTMSGTWEWWVRFDDSSRSETGDIKVFRIGDGRDMAIHFSPFAIKLTRRDGEQQFDTEQIWTFRKVSRRLLTWDELPL